MKAHRVFEKIVSTGLPSAWNERSRVCNEIRLSSSQKSVSRKEHNKTTQLRTHNTLHEERNNDSEGGRESRGRAVNHGGLFPDLET